MMNINFSEVEKLIAIAENAQISELEIMDGAKTIRITTRHGHVASHCHHGHHGKQSHPTIAQSTPQTIPNATQNLTQNIPQTTTQASNQTPSETATTTEPASDSQPIISPMVGTFFRSTEPNAKPLVEIGQAVTANQTLCIIEAMKIMHEVKADKAGTVSEILVNDGDMVEFGQPLFVIK